MALGGSSSERQAAFRSLFVTALDDGLLDEIRTAINTDSAVGSESFLDGAEGKLGRSVRPPTRGRPAKIVTGKLL
jgi:putative transposase